MQFKKLIFISGKGGTGKTTLALRLCHLLKSQGRRPLLVELAKRSSATSLAGWSHSESYQPVSTSSGFAHSCMTGKDCLIEYIGSYLRTQRLTQQVFETSWVQALVDVAPGLNDLAILGKLTSSLRDHGPAFKYDPIVVDSPSTGSFLSLLKAPERLGESVSRGPLYKQSHGISRVLRDPAQVQFIFMGLFEELPVDELEETLETFKDHPTEQVDVVLNKHIDLTAVRIQDPRWQQHMGSILKDQARQKERVLSWQRPVRYMNWLFEPMSLQSRDSHRELLPCL